LYECGVAVQAVERHCRHRAVLLKRSTPAERAFKAQLQQCGLVFREQQGFYFPFYRIADFYLPDRNLIIEIDGPVPRPGERPAQGCVVLARTRHQDVPVPLPLILGHETVGRIERLGGPVERHGWRHRKLPAPGGCA
jgi:hypothetical protein